MIKLVQIKPERDATVWLTFSNGATARWSAADYIARDTVMTRPLADPAFFARAFIECGALAWPNGFELSADALYRRLDAAGTLVQTAA